MKRLLTFTWIACSATAVACGGGEAPEAGQPAATTQAAPPAETAAAPPSTPAPQPAPKPAAPQRARPLVDEPWTPTDTGTVRPGMSRDDVIAVWGSPVAERTAGNWTYLYYRNGCEVSCGTFDVVFLENGQVVDAIVRGPGHTYAGVSSSPKDRPAQFTPPGGPPPGQPMQA